MARYLKIFTIWILLMSAMVGEDAFERNCVGCHVGLPTSLGGMLMNYIQVYGGEKNTKAALIHFMRYPREDTSVMSEMFLQSHPIKKPLQIGDKELQEAIDIYWEKYKVIGKLR